MKLTINVPNVPTQTELKSALISIIEMPLPAETVVFLQRVITQTVKANVDETPNCALEQVAKTEEKKKSKTVETVEDKKI